MSPSHSTPNAYTSLLNVPQFPFVDELVAQLKSLFDFSVAEGYEDETGFHFADARSPSGESVQSEPEWLGEYI